jgi:NAD(P)-dependent dehydrogenase (short-subunit alcohol dehydrogenase family)
LVCWFVSTRYSAMSEPLRVLIIGATGVFGSRLAERLALEPGIELVLAARGEAALRTLARSLATRLGGIAAIQMLDRATLSAGDLAGCDLVIDAAGPFQTSGVQVIEAALKARIDYVDLADGRAFVRDIVRFDTQAKAAGIAVLSGASSIPALSHAVLDRLTAGWRAVETIKVGIFPGNRAPRGRAVVEAILSYTGKPVRLFREGRWQQLPGWGQTHRWKMADGTRRWASICDTPEQDLLVGRYRPARAAEFYAGLELSVLHLGLTGLSLLVRWRLLHSLVPAAGMLLWLAQRLLRFGSDSGVMDVQVTGRDQAGCDVSARWTLRAGANRGPYVPVLAAVVLVRRYRDGQRPEPGARACAGLLSLAEFDRDLATLKIETVIS